MTAPNCHDPASDAIDVFIMAMKMAFKPDDENCPPLGGGSSTVYFLAGDGGLPPWNPNCDEPFLWVRAANRYRARAGDFPAAYVGDNNCKTADVKRVLAIEVGVMRCTGLNDEPNWDRLTNEANISLDDSWRIERALCSAAMGWWRKDRPVATDTVAPYGPDGGVTAWTGMAYVQF